MSEDAIDAPDTADAAEAIETVAGWVRQAARVVVLTGAGISTESGIPDFRGPQGVWTKNPGAERTATIQHYIADRDHRVRSWASRADSPMRNAVPNAGHLALTDLEQKGRLDTLVTQNIDGLHHDAGTSPDRIIEIHGTVREYACLGCADRGPIEVVLEWVRNGDEDPHCNTCGDLIKSATISFGQSLIAADLERAQQAAASCDLFLAIGTSLTVYPVAALPEIAIRAGAPLVILNAEETPYDTLAAATLRGALGETLPAIVERV